MRTGADTVNAVARAAANGYRHQLESSVTTLLVFPDSVLALAPSPSPLMYRKAAHRLQQLSARTARFTEQSRFSSALSTQSFPRRAYTLHIAASWAGKPVDAQTKQHAKPFASTSEIGAWRDQTLAANNSLGVADAGEDFFYIEQVRGGTLRGWNPLIQPSLPFRCVMAR